MVDQDYRPKDYSFKPRARVPQALINNLDGLKKKCLKNNEDWVHANVGYEGKGKSTLGLICCNVVDPNFQPLKQTVYTADEFVWLVDELPSNEMRAVLIDEGSELLFNREALTKSTRKAIKKLKVCREKNLFIWINYPSPDDIDKKLWQRLKSLSKCSADRKGLSFWWWGRRTVRGIYNNGIGDVDFDTYWLFDKIPMNSVFWKDYIEKKSRGTSSTDEEEEQIGFKEIVKEVRENIERYEKSYWSPTAKEHRKTLVKGLIEYDFGCNSNTAKKVTNVVRKLEGWI